MLALCSMLYPTNYAKNYAGIMGAGLDTAPFFGLRSTLKIFIAIADAAE